MGASPEVSVGRRIAPLFPTVAASFLGYAMMATLFVPMLMSPTDGYLPPDTSLAARTTTIGLMLALYPLGQFLGNPAARQPLRPLRSPPGHSRVDRRDDPLLLRHRDRADDQELGDARAVPAALRIGRSDVRADHERNRRRHDPNGAASLLGFLYATTSLAYVVGPLLGGVIAEYIGYALPFWIVLVVLVGGADLACSSHSPRRCRNPPGTRHPLLRSLAGLSQVITDDRLRRNYLGNFLVFVAAFGFWRLITIYLVDEWGLSVGPVTACYAALAVAGASRTSC